MADTRSEPVSEAKLITDDQAIRKGSEREDYISRGREKIGPTAQKKTPPKRG